MTWRLELEPAARDAILQVTGVFLLELKERINAFAEDPIPQLGRTVLGEGPSPYYFEYRSKHDSSYRRRIFVELPESGGLTQHSTEKAIRVVAVTWIADDTAGW